MISLYSLLNPNDAITHRELLIDIANAGDFGRYEMREAVRICFAISAHADKRTSPLDQALFSKPYPEYTAALYSALLPTLPDMIENSNNYRQYWEKEEIFLDQSEEAIKTDKVLIEEIPTLDLAIVTLPENSPLKTAHQFFQEISTNCHPIAINNATDCHRILRMRGNCYEVQFRYETWVQYTSKKTMQRVDLAPLAESLSRQEGGNAKWTFGGVEALSPCLKLQGAAKSKIAPSDFRKQVEAFLAEAHPAWDPYDLPSKDGQLL